MRVVSVSEMRELDRRTIEDFGVASLVLMENAGRGVSDIAFKMLMDLSGTKTDVFCGTGNNGGDGFVAARYLARFGIDVKVYIVGDKSVIKGEAHLNLAILEKMGVSIKETFSLEKIDADIVIDAIFGIGLKGEVREPAKSVIKKINLAHKPVISIDAPSGLDADTGEAPGEAIRAAKTVTMQFPKKGFYLDKGPEYTSEIVAIDIGIIC